MTKLLSPTEPSSAPPPVRLLGLALLLGASQGLAIWLATDALDLGRPALVAVDALLVVLGAGLQLLWLPMRDRPRAHRLLSAVVLVAVLVGASGGWTALQHLPSHGEDWTFSWVVGAVLASTVLFASLANWQEHGLAWPKDNALADRMLGLGLTVGIALFCVGLFWVVLLLWGGLFDLVGVGVFEDLFEEPWFGFPASFAVLGGGIVLARGHARLLPALLAACSHVASAGLVLLSMVLVVFAPTLLWQGVGLLWDTGRATPILLGVVVLHLLFLNGHLARQSGWPGWLRWLVRLAAALLPGYALLALWSLALRVGQYGLLPERLLGIATVLVAVLLAGLTALALWQRRLPVRAAVGRANLVGALAWVAVMAVLHLPGLDQWRLSTWQQLARLQDGRSGAEAFDWAALRFRLGQPGRQAFAELSARDWPEPVAAQIAAAGRAEHPWALQPVLPVAAVVVHTLHGAAAPAAVLQRLAALGQCVPPHGCQSLRQDLDGDGAGEVLLAMGTPEQLYQVQVWAQQDGDWVQVGELRLPQFGLAAKDLAAAFSSGHVRVAPPARWRGLLLGEDRVLQFVPTGPAMDRLVRAAPVLAPDGRATAAPVPVQQEPATPPATP